MFGRLSLEAFQHDAVQNFAVIGGTVNALLILVLITYLGRWGWLWKEWITTVDHKKIGIMYIVVSLIMFLKGFADAMMMRLQQATSVGDAQGLLTSTHFQEVFSAHGSTMIFFVAMGFVFGIINLILPLQIGARDLAFPFLNALGFWLYAAGALLTLTSLAIGQFAISGWLAYPPLSCLQYSPGEGTDYWIWMIQISGIGSTMSGINFLVTILKMRCPGMSLLKMPIFVWSVLCAMILVILAFPILTGTLLLMTLDRYLEMHFFTPSHGGNAMLYFNLIWAWGHPEVYILILPIFGIFSEIVPTFSEKRLFGYMSMVWAMAMIGVLSFLVWLHHFFTMGASPNVNTFFSIMTMLVAIPTGVKIFNWLFTKFRGKVHFTSPMLWFFAFILNFSVGGMTGILLSAPPVNFQVHNSLFLVAHFHGMVIGGVLFGLFAGFTYWFPKYTGFFINEKLNRWAFWFWFTGFLVAFMPLYMLGFMGATRRLDHYEASTGWQPLFLIALFGALIITIGALIQFAGLFWSIYKGSKSSKLCGANPWNGRTLEWSTSSPPPIYNFARIPVVNQLDPLWAENPPKEMQEGIVYEDIHLPANTSIPVVIGGLSFLFGFAMVWYIYWLAIGSFIAILGFTIYQLSTKENHMIISAEEVQATEERHSKEATQT
jgi:cytochrome o ubiquinol oxidase subunit 1